MQNIKEERKGWMKRRLGSRVLAVLTALSMVLSLSGFSAAAESTEVFDVVDMIAADGTETADVAEVCSEQPTELSSGGEVPEEVPDGQEQGTALAGDEVFTSTPDGETEQLEIQTFNATPPEEEAVTLSRVRVELTEDTQEIRKQGEPFWLHVYAEDMEKEAGRDSRVSISLKHKADQTPAAEVSAWAFAQKPEELPEVWPESPMILENSASGRDGQSPLTVEKFQRAETDEAGNALTDADGNGILAETGLTFSVPGGGAADFYLALLYETDAEEYENTVTAVCSACQTDEAETNVLYIPEEEKDKEPLSVTWKPQEAQQGEAEAEGEGEQPPEAEGEAEAEGEGEQPPEAESESVVEDAEEQSLPDVRVTLTKEITETTKAALKNESSETEVVDVEETFSETAEVFSSNEEPADLERIKDTGEIISLPESEPYWLHVQAEDIAENASGTAEVKIGFRDAETGSAPEDIEIGVYGEKQEAVENEQMVFPAAVDGALNTQDNLTVNCITQEDEANPGASLKLLTFNVKPTEKADFYIRLNYQTEETSYEKNIQATLSVRAFPLISEETEPQSGNPSGDTAEPIVTPDTTLVSPEQAPMIVDIVSEEEAVSTDIFQSAPVLDTDAVEMTDTSQTTEEETKEEIIVTTELQEVATLTWAAAMVPTHQGDGKIYLDTTGMTLNEHFPFNTGSEHIYMYVKETEQYYPAVTESIDGKTLLVWDTADQNQYPQNSQFAFVYCANGKPGAIGEFAKADYQRTAFVGETIGEAREIPDNGNSGNGSIVYNKSIWEYAGYSTRVDGVKTYALRRQLKTQWGTAGFKDGDGMVEIPNEDPGYDSSKFHAKATFYDYYSNRELKGKKLFEEKGTFTEDYFQNVNGKASDLSAWRMQGSQLNYGIVQYYMKKGTGYSPLYFGDFGVGWDSYQDNGKGAYNGTPGWTIWAEPSQLNFEPYRNGNTNATPGLVSPQLDNGHLLTSDGSRAPYFYPEFLRGDNADTMKLGMVYSDVDFPFDSIEKDGVQYWEFDSGKSNLDKAQQYASRLVQWNGSYYLKRTNEIVNGPGNNPTPGFFPFNGQKYSGQQEYLDYMFGVEMEIPFDLTKDGTVKNKSGVSKPIEFEFSGDDDVWVFVDNQLVLDIGGQHHEVHGKINFQDGNCVVERAVDSVRNDQTQNVNTNLDAAFNDLLNWRFNETNMGHHTMKIFYMERGLWDSNLKIQFNMIPQKNHLEVEKTVDVTGVNSGLQTAVQSVDSFGMTIAGGTEKAYKYYDASADATTDGYNTGHAGSFTLQHGDKAIFEQQFEDKIGESIQVQETVGNSVLDYTTSWDVREQTYDKETKEYKDKTEPYYTYEGTASSFEFKKRDQNELVDVEIPTTAKLTYKNKVNTTELDLTKKVVNTANQEISDTTDFNFKVEFSFDGGTKYTGYPFQYTVCKDGSQQPGNSVNASDNGSITLQAGQTAKITGVPKGAKYRITETIVDGELYELESVTVNGTAQTSENLALTGEIEKAFAQQAEEVVFTNKKKVQYYPLKITKKLVDATNNSVQDGESTFQFEVKVAGVLYTGAYTIGGTAASTENGMITLKGGQTAEISLPEGTAYSVEELTTGNMYGYWPSGVTVNNVQSSNAAVGTGTINTSNNNVVITNKKVAKGLRIAKVDAEDNQITLSGAEFELVQTKHADDSEVTDAAPMKVTTGANGIAAFDGKPLTPGTWKLTEVTAPNGYNLLKDAITIVVAKDGRVTVDEQEYTTGDTVELTIANRKGFGLPATGSWTRYILMAAGVLLAGTAMNLYLLTKRRKKRRRY